MDNYKKLESLVCEKFNSIGDDKVIIGNVSMSGEQISNSIENGDDNGIYIMNSLIQLTIDLLLRGKEKIDG